MSVTMTWTMWCACVAVIGCSAAEDHAPCDPTAKFTAVTPLTGYAFPTPTLQYHGVPRLSADELTMYFHGVPPNSGSSSYLYMATRQTRDDDFGAPTAMTEMTSATQDFDPSVTTDGLTLWFASERAGDTARLYVATRTATTDAFASATMATISSDVPRLHDDEPDVSRDGAELYFVSGASQGSDLWRAAITVSGIGAATPITALNTTLTERGPVVSGDRLTLYFYSNRSDASGIGPHVWVAHRATVADEFGAPTPVDELDAFGMSNAGWLSADNCRLYGASDTSAFIMATR